MVNDPYLQLPTPLASCCHFDPPVDGVVVLNGRIDGVSCVSAVAPLSQRDAGLFECSGKLAGIVASLDRAS